MHGHLVTVEVGVKGGTDQWVQLDGLAFDQHRLKGLDAETMQGRRTVKHNGMLANHLIQDIPDFRAFFLHHLLRGLDGRGQATTQQLVEDERLEQLQRHFLGQAALMQFQGRPYHDDGAAGVVDTLTQQVLTEATLFALDHIGQRFQRTLVGAGNGTAATAVVHQRVNGFLQHAFFVAHDNVRCVQLEQALQAVVTVDNATVQVIQVGGGKTAAIQRYQRTQIRWQYRQYGHNHPFRTVTRSNKGLNQLQALGQAFQLGLGLGSAHVLADLELFLFQHQAFQHFVDRFGAHARVELVTVLFNGLKVGFIAQQHAFFQRGQTRLDNNECFEIQNTLDFAQGHVQQQADA